MKLIFPNYQKRIQLKSVVPLSNQGSTRGLLLESTRRKKLVPLILVSVKGWSLPGSLIAGNLLLLRVLPRNWLLLLFQAFSKVYASDTLRATGPGIGIET